MKENETPVTAEPMKLKRHFILVVLAVSLLCVFVGGSFGSLIVSPIKLFFPDMDAGNTFLVDFYLTFIGIDIAVLAYCAVFEKDIFRSFLHPKQGGSAGNTGRSFAFGLFIGFAMNAVCVLVAWLLGDVQFYVGSFRPLYLLCALLCVCIQSGAEELLARGYMMGALSKRYPVWVGIAANTLFFAALHLTNNGITVISFLCLMTIAFALSLVMHFFGSIWMCIAIHTAWNFTQNFLFGLPNSGIVSQSSFLHLEAARQSLFYHVAFGVEGSVTAVLVIAVFGAAVVLYAIKHDLKTP